ncbi:hypothetical protein BRD00_06045 [Halobacteriales archaeon QS_8_69_26]|nr:MAG: hypothetical protein BRD00_06045 [Halobacteriales archaeon QS_8_69_26]
MARFYRCTQCGTLQGTVGAFSQRPEECDECSNREFEIVGPEKVGFVARVLGNLSTARAVRIMVGLGAFSFIGTILLSLFGLSRLVLGTGGINFVVLLGLAYALTRHSMAAWWASLVVMIVGAILAVMTVVAELGVPVFGPETESVGLVLAALAVVYALVYLAVVANLVGGRDEYVAEVRG